MSLRLNELMHIKQIFSFWHVANPQYTLAIIKNHKLQSIANYLWLIPKLIYVQANIFLCCLA